jgi:NAD(P)-dependent dehydrogenase (short-subunit alcohol dehydrogenase family)
VSEFDSKVVLITGCGRVRGMGRAISLAFARAGADIALHASRLEPADLAFIRDSVANDDKRRADQAEEQLKTQSLSAYYDAIPMKALLLAQTDAAQGKLSHDKQAELRATMEEIIDDLSDHPDTPPAGDGKTSEQIKERKPARS